MSETPRYHWGLRLLHWCVAALVLLQIPAGLLIAGYEQDTVKTVDAALGEGAFNGIYDLHKSVGLTILALMILRVVVRASHGAPPYAEPLAPLRRVAAGSVHAALYVLLIVTPVIGWLGVSAYPAPVPVYFLFDAKLPVAADRAWSDALLGGAHGPLGLLIGVLVSVHVLAALHHRLVLRDGVLGRMTG
ncbi:MAG: cytochrome b [Pseudomonadota bacterium]